MQKSMWNLDNTIPIYTYIHAVHEVDINVLSILIVLNFNSENMNRKKYHSGSSLISSKNVFPSILMLLVLLALSWLLSKKRLPLCSSWISKLSSSCANVSPMVVSDGELGGSTGSEGWTSTVHLCLFKCDDWENDFGHVLHTYGFSPVWILSWIFNLPLSLKALWHLLQAYGFSPVWVLSCLFKCPFWVYALSHLLQANGFSPVWILSCVFKCWLWLNVFSNCHWCGRPCHI